MQYLYTYTLSPISFILYMMEVTVHMADATVSNHCFKLCQLRISTKKKRERGRQICILDYWNSFLFIFLLLISEPFLLVFLEFHAIKI